MPEDVQELLHAGNCGYGLEGVDRYAAFARLEDVYGVTSSLKVYYVSGDGTFMGIASKDDLDDDTTSRVVLRSSNALAGAIKGDESDVTVADIQSVKNLTIDEAAGITSLSDLYVLGSLESLTLDGVTLSNLNGIQTATKLSYVYIRKSIIDDGDDSTYKEYAALKSMSKLTHLYFYDLDDNDLKKICEGIKDANYPNLEYLAFVGNGSYICSTTDGTGNYKSANKSITSLESLRTLKSSCVGNVKYLSLEWNSIQDTEDMDGNTIFALENLVNFPNLYLLRVEGNKLTTLKGLEDKTDLTYLYASLNNLGKNETYTDLTTITDVETGEVREATDEDRGKNSSNALWALQFTNELYYLRLNGNPDLKWVSYLANDLKIGYLFFGDGSDARHCINMVDTEVGKIRTILSNCGVNKSYPGKYWLSMLDPTDNELEVNLYNQEITQSQFETLGTYTNIKYLNLKYIKIYEVDDENNKQLITEQDEINTLVTSVLKKIENLQYLELSAKQGTSFEKLSNLTFLKGVNPSDSTDDISLKELWALGTEITTGVKDLNGNEISLELLNTYCKEIGVLCINNENTNLQLIESTLKRCFEKETWSHFYSQYRNFWTNNVSVFESLSLCTGLTSISFNHLSFSGEGDLDLSNLKDLTYYYVAGGTTFKSLKFPENITTARVSYFAGNIDFSKVKKLKTLSFYADTTTQLDILKNSLETFSPDCEIDYFEGNSKIFTLGEKYFKVLDELNKSSVHLNIKEIALNNQSSNTDIKSLKGIEDLVNLQIITLKVGTAPDLSDISSLGYISETLKSVNLPNCSISDASVVSQLTHLTNLNLSNNCLAPYVEISNTTESGVVVTKWFTVKEICNRMIANTPTDGNRKHKK